MSLRIGCYGKKIKTYFTFSWRMSFIKYFFCIKRLLLRNKTSLLVIFLSISFSLVLRDVSSKQYFGSIHVCLINYLTSKICRYSSFNYFVPGIILKCLYIRFLFINLYENGLHIKLNFC